MNLYDVICNEDCTNSYKLATNSPKIKRVMNCNESSGISVWRFVFQQLQTKRDLCDAFQITYMGQCYTTYLCCMIYLVSYVNMPIIQQLTWKHLCYTTKTKPRTYANTENGEGKKKKFFEKAYSLKIIMKKCFCLFLKDNKRYILSISVS